MKKILMIGALALFSCSHVYAKARYIATSGAFVTGDLGYGILFTPKDSVSHGQSPSRENIAWSGGFGYNWALDSFNVVGVEADYFDGGNASYPSSDGNLKINSETAAALLSFTSIWENGIDVFLKGGVGYLQQTNDVQNGFVRMDDHTLTGSGTSNMITGVGVVGVGYYLAKGFNIFVDSTYIYGGDDKYWNKFVITGNSPKDIKPASSLQFKLGMSYQF